MSVLFSLRGVNVAYQQQEQRVPVLHEVNFALREGEHIGLYGPNGCGKTTFFRCITGLVQPESGEILFNGLPCTCENDFARLRRHVGFALQQADDQIFFPTVLEDVSFGPLNLGLSQREARQRASRCLADLGMEAFAHHPVHQLSAGEKRLVALAGILAMRPRALLLDEPTTGLDPAATARLVGVLRAIPCARITVAHDLAFVQSISDRILTIREHRLVPFEEKM